jgi:hypothetical protein
MLENDFAFKQNQVAMKAIRGPRRGGHPWYR